MMSGQLRLLFVRHGETQDNVDKILQGWRDTSLSENGHRDAQTVAGKIKDQRIDAVYHSPLIRMVQTIDPVINDHPDAPVKPDPDLRSQCMGELEGGSYDLVDMSNPRSANGKPGVEPFDDFLRRLLRAMARIIGVEAPQVANQDRAVVLATHGVCITSIFKCLEGTPQCEGFFSTNSQREGQRRMRFGIQIARMLLSSLLTILWTCPLRMACWIGMASPTRPS